MTTTTNNHNEAMIASSNNNSPSAHTGDDGNASAAITRAELTEMQETMVARLKGTDDIEARWRLHGRKWASQHASVHELDLNERDLEEFGDQIWVAADFSCNDFAAMFVKLLRKPADISRADVQEFWEPFSAVNPENCEVIWFREGAADAWDEVKERVHSDEVVACK